MTETILPAPARIAPASVTRRRAGGALLGLAGVIFLASAATKLAGVPAVVDQMTKFGFGGKLVWLGALESACALLFLVPRTRAFGLVMGSAFMGGAIATHLQHGESPVPPAFVLALLWLATWLRHPVAAWSFAGRRDDGAAEEPRARTAGAGPGGGRSGSVPASLRAGQVVVGLASLLLMLIGLKYVTDPVGAAASSGIALPSPLGVTNLRAGVGGFALGSGIFGAMHVPFTDRVTAGLRFIVTLFATVFVLRVVSVIADGTAAQSLRVLVPEAVFLLASAVALAVRLRASAGAAPDAGEGGGEQIVQPAE